MITLSSQYMISALLVEPALGPRSTNITKLIYVYITEGGRKSYYIQTRAQGLKFIRVVKEVPLH